MLDAAGEDSSQAVEEADPGYIAEEGKPPSKTQTPHYLFLLSFCFIYIVSCYYILTVGIILVILGKLHITY